MKKWIIIIFSVIWMSSVPARAAEQEYNLLNSKDYQEICALESRICELVNMMLESDTEEAPISAEDIDFSRAYRIDVDREVLKQEDSDVEETDRYLAERSRYIWELPVDAGKHTFVVSLSVGVQPNEQAKDVLTDEEYQQLIDEVGRWGTVSCELLDKGQDIPSRAWAQVKELNLSEPIQIRYIGGDSGIHIVMAIVYENGKPVKMLPMVGAFSIVDERTKTPQTYEFVPDKSYDFEQTQSLIKQARSSGMLGGGGGGQLVISDRNEFPVIPAGIAAVVILAAAGIVIYRKKQG